MAGLISTTIGSALMSPCLKNKSVLEQRQAVVTMEIVIDFINFWTDVASIIEIGTDYNGTVNESLFLLVLLGFLIYAIIVQLSYINSKYNNDENYMLYVLLTFVGISKLQLNKTNQTKHLHYTSYCCIYTLSLETTHMSKYATPSRQPIRSTRVE